MTTAKKIANSEDEAERSEEYERFEALTKALVAVPKSEIQTEADKHDKAKKARKSA